MQAEASSFAPKWTPRGLRQRYRIYVREPGDLLLALQIGVFILRLPSRMRRADLNTFIGGLRKETPQTRRSAFASRDRIVRLRSFLLRLRPLRSFDTCYARAFTLYRFLESAGRVGVHFGIEHRDDLQERLRGHAWVTLNGRLLEGPEVVTTGRICEIPIGSKRRKTIVLTGAAGSVASMLRPLLEERYDVRLTDRQPVRNLRSNERFVQADLGDLEAIRAAVSGADAIVHLGGISQEAPFEDIVEANIRGTYNVFEAARQAGVTRVVLASTGHVNGFYRRSEEVAPDRSPRPDTLYAASKVYGETLARLYADKHGFDVMCIRIGRVDERPRAEWALSIWVSPRDLLQLIEIGLESTNLRYEIVYGISQNSRAWWSNARALELGYLPRDSADAFAADFEPTANRSLASLLQGIDFASRGFTGDVGML